MDASATQLRQRPWVSLLPAQCTQMYIQYPTKHLKERNLHKKSKAASLWSIFHKRPLPDVWQVSEYACVYQSLKFVKHEDHNKLGCLYWEYYVFTLREICPNTEFFVVCIFLFQSEYKKIWIRKNSVFVHFSSSGRGLILDCISLWNED